MISKLASKAILSPNCNPRKNATYNPSGIPDGITIHHTATVGVSAEEHAKRFQNPARQASANYIIGDDGTIICGVDENNRAWTTGSRENDYKKITFEVCDHTGRPDWTISDAAWNSMIALCVDICSRYNIKPTFTGNKKGSFTFHYMFQNTECPGAYIKAHIKHIIDQVNAGLEGQMPTPEPEPEKPTDAYLVKVTVDCLNIRSGAGVKYKKVGEITDHGVYTIVETSGGWGKLKSGAGWIALRYTKGVK